MPAASKQANNEAGHRATDQMPGSCLCGVEGQLDLHITSPFSANVDLGPCGLYIRAYVRPTVRPSAHESVSCSPGSRRRWRPCTTKRDAAVSLGQSKKNSVASTARSTEILMRGRTKVLRRNHRPHEVRDAFAPRALSCCSCIQDDTERRRRSSRESHQLWINRFK